MIRPFVDINFQQIPTPLYKQRDYNFDIDFVTSYRISSGWESKTDKATIEFPKNIVIKGEDNVPIFKMSGASNVVLGGSGIPYTSGVIENIDSKGEPNKNAPLIMRGDVVTISDGYYFKNEAGQDTNVGAVQFKGFVSSVGSKIPIEIELEDNFYLLKRTPFDKTFWSDTLLNLIVHVVELVNENFNAKNSLYPLIKVYDKPDNLTAQFSLGYLDIDAGMSCCMVLEKLKSLCNLDSFFNEDVLHFGFPIYDEDTAISKNFFEIGNNIFDDPDLTYKNKDDFILSAIVTCSVIETSSKSTFDGVSKTKKSRLSVLVWWDSLTQDFKFINQNKGTSLSQLQKGNLAGDQEGGNMFKWPFPASPTNPPSIQTLANYGINQLKKYLYTGFRGSFKTFGYPFVNWNDNVNIVDKTFTDRNGQYKVKKTAREGGMDGITQEIFLDFKQQVSVPIDTVQIFML